MISAVSPDMPEKLLKMIVGHSESMDTQGVYSHEMIGEAERAALADQFLLSAGSYGLRPVAETRRFPCRHSRTGYGRYSRKPQSRGRKLSWSQR